MSSTSTVAWKPVPRKASRCAGRAGVAADARVDDELVLAERHSDRERVGMRVGGDAEMTVGAVVENGSETAGSQDGEAPVGKDEASGLR